ncbi:hypothetical protein [Agromyces archimandritae]|uniref:Uncharacterized protein n=1 Tax=Agromyces archimandritae TaxID=2781962 RepID=A0A975IQN4_9MICO|nr:hypothetical protein [Agromyces archimandritae]QTX05226.1 hypothetical protein G127AT_03065 [Agromyces archimandritae]
MRWDLLFDDLESQLDEEHREEERALRVEEERLRLGRLSLRDRILALMRADGETGTITLELHGGASHAVRPDGFGRDWLSGDLHDEGRRVRQCVVALDRIAAVVPNPSQLPRSLASLPEASSRFADRIGLAFVLRDLCRRRRAVTVTTIDGVHHGTIDRVGRDHFDLAVHEAGTPRREREVRQLRIVPIERLVLVVLD